MRGRHCPYSMRYYTLLFVGSQKETIIQTCKVHDEPFVINNSMKINQLCDVLNKQDVKGGAVTNVERMSNAVRKVLTEDAKLMSQGKDAYEQERQKDFERKCAEDMKSNRKMTFTEMVNRYL